MEATLFFNENEDDVQTFAKVAGLVIVPELQGFVDSSRGSTWYSSSKQAWEWAGNIYT